MTRNITRCTAFLAGLALFGLLALGASAEGIRIRPRYAVGDEYVVSLATTTRTDILARGEVAKSIEDEVELRYSARVEVVEVAADGSPVRERHEAVKLSFVKDGESRSLLKQDAELEVVRAADGAVQIFHDGKPVEPKLEKVVGHMLARQLEHGVAALVDPGRAVEIGETWRIADEQVRAFMRDRGIQDAELAGKATATLVGTVGSRLIVRYRIPVDGFALGELPSNARNARSQASVDGEVDLAADGLHRPVAHFSALAVRIKATMSEPGKSRAAAWSVRRSESIVQRSETLTDQLASSS